MKRARRLSIRAGLAMSATGLLAITALSVSTVQATAAQADSVLAATSQATTTPANTQATPFTSDNVILSGIAAPSATSAWAVGGYEAGSAEIWHWNGSRWSTTPLPASPPGLSGVAASGGEAWAVGSTGGQGPATNLRTAALRWLRGKWVRVSTPTPRYGGALNGAAIVPDGTAWAVGYGDPIANEGGHPLILHWNGSQWGTAAITQQPGMVPDFGVLTAVTAPAINSAWAVGGDGRDPLIFHWDGHHWTRAFPASIPDNTLFGTLYGVAASSPTNAWAVGNAIGPGPQYHAYTLIMHWDGHRWNRVPSPTVSLKTGGTWLSSVTVTPKGEAWAVGYTLGGTGVTVILHWTGGKWVQVPSPNPYQSAEGTDYYAMPLSVAVASNGLAWTVGWVGPDSQSLLLKWNGHIWQPQSLLG